MPKPPPKPSPEYPEGRYRRDITGESIEGEEVLPHSDYLAAQGRWIYSREGQRPRVLFVRSGFSPPPGVGLQGDGGFFCRKIRCF